MQLFDMGSSLKGKNLLLKEQIPFFKSGPSLKREAKIELLPLIVFPFILIQFIKVFWQWLIYYTLG